MRKKQFQRRFLTLFPVIGLFTGVALIAGCAGSQSAAMDKQFQKMAEKQRLKQEAPEDVDLEKKLSSTEDPKICEQKGDNYLRTGNYGMSFIEYKKALDADPNQVRVRLKLANLFLKRKMWKDALKEFQEIEKLAPGNLTAYQGKAAALIQLDRLDEAEGTLTMVISKDSGLWQAYALLGNLYSAKKQYGPAIEAYEKAIAINPKNAVLQNRLGDSLIRAGRYQESVDISLKAIQSDTFNQETYNTLGFALFKLGMFTEACEAFIKGSNEAEAYNKMGILFMETKDYARSVECFEKAINAKPAYYEAAHDGLKKAKAALKDTTKN